MPACDPVLLKYKLSMLRRASMRMKAKVVMMDINVRKRRRALRREAALGAEIARRLAEVQLCETEKRKNAKTLGVTRFQKPAVHGHGEQFFSIVWVCLAPETTLPQTVFCRQGAHARQRTAPYHNIPNTRQCARIWQHVLEQRGEQEIQIHILVCVCSSMYYACFISLSHPVGTFTT